MATNVVQLKDLPVISKEVDINMDDRIVVSHLFNRNTRASTSMTMDALANKILFDMASGISGKRLHGETDPARSLGTNGDLYFKIVDKTITTAFLKQNNMWTKLGG